MRVVCEMEYNELGACDGTAEFHVRVEGAATGVEYIRRACEPCLRLMAAGRIRGGQLAIAHALIRPACTHPDGEWRDEGCLLPESDIKLDRRGRLVMPAVLT